MKRIATIGIAALFLATGTAQAGWYQTRWECQLEWTGDEPATIKPKDIPELLENFKYLKKHCAWLQCLEDREKGKVKHCYANDRRWR